MGQRAEWRRMGSRSWGTNTSYPVYRLKETGSNPITEIEEDRLIGRWERWISWEHGR